MFDISMFPHAWSSFEHPVPLQAAARTMRAARRTVERTGTWPWAFRSCCKSSFLILLAEETADEGFDGFAQVDADAVSITYCGVIALRCYGSDPAGGRRVGCGFLLRR